MTRTCPFAPVEEHVRLRREAPVSWAGLPGGIEAWVLTRYEDVRAMLTDPRFSSDRSNPSYPRSATDRLVLRPAARSMIAMDQPEHGAERRAVTGEFTARRLAELRPRIQRIVDEHIGAMLAGPRPADLVRALSLPVPSQVICELLGVPYADHDFFQERSGLLLRPAAPLAERERARDELESYLDDLVTRKEAEPTDDLLGRQIRKRRENGTADHDAMVSLAILLLIAGHETTANMISLGTLMLLQNPGQLALIREDPAKTEGAVEELLRYFTIAEIATSRFAKEDAEIGGVPIRAGEGVIGLSNTANRDPEAFDNPDEFDVERGARHHLAFGFGIHQCLGQNLARMELRIVFDTLFARVPSLGLAAPVDDLPFKTDGSVYGIYELPVTW